MRPAIQILLSGCLSFGIPLLLAVCELAALRRGRDTGGWRPRPDPSPDAPRPLPSCLLVPDRHPGKDADRVRELELV